MNYDRALADYHIRNRQRADELVQTLCNLVIAYRTEGTALEKIAAMETLLPDRGEGVIQDCEEHMAHAGDNFFPFLWKFYKSHRAVLFRLLMSITVRATTQNTAFEEVLCFLLAHAPKTGDWLAVPEETHIDISWMPEAWRRLVVEQYNRDEAPTRLNRRYFEMCAFSHLMVELKSGDLSIPGSNHFSDYRDQLLPWEEYHRNIAAYGKMVGLPVEGAAFVSHMKARLSMVAQETDKAFPENTDLRIENGEPILRRPAKALTPP